MYIVYTTYVYIYSLSEQTNKTFNNLANFAPGFFEMQIRNSQIRDPMRIFKAITQIFNSNLDCQIHNLSSDSKIHNSNSNSQIHNSNLLIQIQTIKFAIQT